MLDAINGTPVLDIKPVFKEFRPAVEIRQPEWVADLMKKILLSVKRKVLVMTKVIDSKLHYTYSLKALSFTL